MKRIIYFLMALVFITGCSQYEYEPSDSGLTVTESVLEFAANGGEGYILVESDNSIGAESNSDWCQVKVNGKRIEVTVAPFNGVENRTAVVSISAGKDYPVNVPVTQTAAQFIIEDLTFDVDFLQTSLETTVVSDEEVTVSSSESWIESSYANGVLSITVDRNNNPEVRVGTVLVTSKNITQSIAIRQTGRSLAYEDVLGNYVFSFQLFNQATVHNVNVSFTESETSGYYDVIGMHIGILRVRFNNAQKTLEIYGGHNMGPDPEYPGWTIAALVLSSDGYISWSPDYFYKGTWNNGFDEEMGFTFGDSGTWPDRQVAGLYIVSSNQYPVVSGSYEYLGLNYTKVTLTKIID